LKDGARRNHLAYLTSAADRTKIGDIVVFHIFVLHIKHQLIILHASFRSMILSTRRHRSPHRKASHKCPLILSYQATSKPNNLIIYIVCVAWIHNHMELITNCSQWGTSYENQMNVIKVTTSHGQTETFGIVTKLYIRLSMLIRNCWLETRPISRLLQKNAWSPVATVPFCGCSMQDALRTWKTISPRT